MEIQTIIKNRRLELGLTMKEVAKALGVAEGTISRYESGEIQNMGIDKIEALSKILRCSPGYLMGWQDEADPGCEYTNSNEEKLLLSKFRLLNNDGRRKLVERSDELLALGYTKTEEEGMKELA